MATTLEWVAQPEDGLEWIGPFDETGESDIGDLTRTTFDGAQVYYALSTIVEGPLTIPAGSLFWLNGSPLPSAARRVADDGFYLYTF
jgi:hypothetical protein